MLLYNDTSAVFHHRYLVCVCVTSIIHLFFLKNFISNKIIEGTLVKQIIDGALYWSQRGQRKLMVWRNEKGWVGSRSSSSLSTVSTCMAGIFSFASTGGRMAFCRFGLCGSVCVEVSLGGATEPGFLSGCTTGAFAAFSAGLIGRSALGSLASGWN